MNQDIAVMIIKSFTINIFVYFTILKIYNVQNHKRTKEIVFIIASIIGVGITGILDKKVPSEIIIIIMYIFQVIVAKLTINNKEYSMIIGGLVSSAITYVGFAICMIIEIGIKIIFNIKYPSVDCFIIFILMCILFHILSKTRRISRGINFLRERSFSNYLEVLILNISAVVFFTYCLFGNYYGYITEHILFTFIVVGIIMIIMIQKTLTLYYKQKLLQQNIESYKEEIKEKDEKIKELSDEKFKISKLNHEFYNRQRALELKVEEFINNANMEASGELSIIDQIKNMTDEYSTKQQEINNVSSLPKTGITEIDDMFAYMQSECNKNKIEFILKINGNIYHLINNIIAKDRLVTLIGDHLRDAIIAINNSSNTYRSIMAILGMKDNTYEFRVYDTGIEFEIETLLKLGLEPATTHKDQGGTGIGFITTFETLKETKASLVIEENHPENDKDYTKCVSIKFDGKNEYKIISYRADKIKAEAKDNRIIIKKL